MSLKAIELDNIFAIAFFIADVLFQFIYFCGCFFYHQMQIRLVARVKCVMHTGAAAKKHLKYLKKYEINFKLKMNGIWMTNMIYTLFNIVVKFIYLTIFIVSSWKNKLAIFLSNLLKKKIFGKALNIHCTHKKNTTRRACSLINTWKK